MENDIKKSQPHNVNIESFYFEEFVFSSLRQEGVEKTDSYLLHDRYKSFASKKFDGFLPDGLYPYVKERAFLEVKYTNNIHYINRYIANLEEKMHLFYRLVIICLVSQKDLELVQKPDNITVLGAEYVSELAVKNPTGWLFFSVSCRPEDNVISYDENKRTFILKNKSLASTMVQFSEEDVKNLSLVNKKAFFNELNLYYKPALFIGNGASVCFGSDLWKPLVDYLFDYLTPKYVDNPKLVRKAIGDTTFSLSSMSKYLIDKTKYYSAIYSSLYRKYEDSMHGSNTLIRSAVKVKIMYPEMPVITYNYDNFFEIDYRKFSSHSISSVDSRDADNATAEPKVRHVHGLFPFGKSTSKPNLVLTQEEYYDAYRESVNWTPLIQKEILKDYTCLFVGSSMSDLYQMSIIDEVFKEHYVGKITRPWKCFALLCLKDLSPRDIYSVCNYYASKGVSVIFTEDFKDLPEELLKIFTGR